MIIIKTNFEIKKIKEACKIVSVVLKKIDKYIKPGVTKYQLNNLIETWIRRYKAEPAFLGYRGFPASTCISIDEEVVHGIPNGTTLKGGQLVKIDVGVKKDGYYGDAARTYIVGSVSKDKKKLVEVTETVLYNSIKVARANKRVGDISATIQEYVESFGFSVVRELGGHGVGVHLHEEPIIPNYGERDTGILLKKGMTIAIEPMVNMGTYKVKTARNGWTIVTMDNLPSAHFEHTILIDDEPVILTDYREL